MYRLGATLARRYWRCCCRCHVALSLVVAWWAEQSCRGVCQCGIAGAIVVIIVMTCLLRTCGAGVCNADSTVCVESGGVRFRSPPQQPAHCAAMGRGAAKGRGLCQRLSSCDRFVRAALQQPRSWCGRRVRGEALTVRMWLSLVHNTAPIAANRGPAGTFESEPALASLPLDLCFLLENGSVVGVAAG